MPMPSADAIIRQTSEHRTYEPLSVRGSAAEYRIAHALEALAGAMCRIDQRLALLLERGAGK